MLYFALCMKIDLECNIFIRALTLKTKCKGTNHTEAGDSVLSSTGMHVAGLLALWPLQTLGNAVRLFDHMGI